MDGHKGTSSPSAGKYCVPLILLISCHGCSKNHHQMGPYALKSHFWCVFCRFLTYHRCWHICICCTRAIYGLPLWFKGKQINNIQTNSELIFRRTQHMFFLYFPLLVCIIVISSMTFWTSVNLNLCFSSHSQTCTASGCSLSSYSSPLGQRWSGSGPLGTWERGKSQIRSAKDGQSWLNTSWNWRVKSQVFGPQLASFYRVNSSAVKTLYVVHGQITAL